MGKHRPEYKPDKGELERFFALSIDMLCIAGFDGYFKLVNSAWETTLGFSIEEMLSRPFAEFLHPDDRDATAATYAAQMAEGRDVIEFDNRYLCKDGSYRWLLWNARTVPERELIYAVARDITERKRMEAELHLLNESLEQRVRERTKSLSQANRKLRAQVAQRQRAEQEVRLLQTLTVAINEAEDIDSALTTALRKVCEATGWVLGQAWVPQSDGTALECSTAWYTTAAGLATFRKASECLTLRTGVGLPGRVWRTKQPAWIRDVTVDRNFPRASAASAVGFRAGLAVPILAGPEVVAIIEFFMFKRRRQDAALLEMVSAVASQVGWMMQRKQAEEKARYFSHFDALTGLPNRALLKDRLNVAVAQARGDGGVLALILVGLDRLEMLNDTAGTQLLQVVATRLRHLAREGDTVARVSGDEFAMLLVVGRPQEAVYVARRLLEGLRGRRTVDGYEFHVTASLGIAMFPGDGDDADALLSNAEIAMHRIKERSGDEYQLYAPKLNAQMLERLSLENSIRRALERREFDVYYQPQVDGQSGMIVGAEALVRWNHLDRGLVSPGEFIPVAEEAGLITELGDWVLRTACEQTTRWREQGVNLMRIAVNLAARQCQEPRLVQKVADVLRKTRLDAACLELEITEGSLIADAASTIASLRSFREMGVRVSLDDFGTGYSSLSYLRNLPIDTLKIDQSLVRSLNTDPSGAAITAAIIAMAHILGLKVIAEGVEDEFQLAFLKERNCNEFQGYLFGKPMPARDLQELLAKRLTPRSLELAKRSDTDNS
jgi:diguanylate cyclase (GGDEF)-like protein/PAS domain S-box-containing protein